MGQPRVLGFKAFGNASSMMVSNQQARMAAGRGFSPANGHGNARSLARSGSFWRAHSLSIVELVDQMRTRAQQGMDKTLLASNPIRPWASCWNRNWEGGDWLGPGAIGHHGAGGSLASAIPTRRRFWLKLPTHGALCTDDPRAHGASAAKSIRCLKQWLIQSLFGRSMPLRAQGA